jgi:hypothetical protein
MDKIFLKIYGLVHALVFTCSCSQAHGLASLGTSSSSNCLPKCTKKKKKKKKLAKQYSFFVGGRALKLFNELLFM